MFLPLWTGEGGEPPASETHIGNLGVMNKPVVFGILSFAVAFAAFVFLMRRPPVETPTGEAAKQKSVTSETKPGESGIRRKISAKLFFTAPGTKYLISEDRSILYHETLLAQAKEVLIELANGSSTDLASTLPQGTKLQDLFISKEGIAYADFSGELISNHPGGTDGEISTVYSIVNTLTLNFPQIRKVQILVNGNAVITLKGHLDLSRPLVQDLSFVSAKGQPATDPGVVEKQESWNNEVTWNQITTGI